MHISTPKVKEKKPKKRKKNKIVLIAAPLASKAIFRIYSRKTAAS